MQTEKTLIRLCGCTGWSESSLGTQVILLVLSCSISCIHGKDSDQPAHPQSLISLCCLHEEASYPWNALIALQRLQWNWTLIQADPILCWGQSFSFVVPRFKCRHTCSKFVDTSCFATEQFADNTGSHWEGRKLRWWWRGLNKMQ